MITREQVADLREGDVVEYAGHPDLRGAKIVGPLRATGAGLLCVGEYFIRDAGGEPGRYARERLTLTVISRAPRPLYVNHSRTEPVVGDVVRDADSDIPTVWMYDGFPDLDAPWNRPGAKLCSERHELPARLRLLVDGETGQVVP